MKLCQKVFRFIVTLTWSFMWWCQFINWLKFETRPSSLLNFGTSIHMSQLHVLLMNSRITYVVTFHVSHTLVLLYDSSCINPLSPSISDWLACGTCTFFDQTNYCINWQDWKWIIDFDCLHVKSHPSVIPLMQYISEIIENCIIG